MNEQAATQIANVVMSASQQIANTIELVETHEPPASAKAYSDAGGQVMFRIHALLEPIWTEHPELRP